MREQPATLLEDGFELIPGIGGEYVHDLVSDVTELRRIANERRDSQTECPSGFYTSDGTLWNREDNDLLTHLQLTYRTSAALLRFALDKVIVDHLQPLLGPNIETFGQGQCLLKPPGSTFSKHWHQDDAFFPHRYGVQIAALMYLQDTTEENGALRVVPRSHEGGLLAHGDSSSHLESSLPMTEGEIVTGNAGDVILLHGLTLHSSGPNTSSNWRYVALNRYRTAGDYVVRTGTTVDNMKSIDVPFAPPGSAIGQEGLLVAGCRPLSDAPGWAWPIWQQNQFPA